jgi:hypothetical protein
MSGIRRVFTYIINLVTLGVFAAGIRTLLFLLFDTLFSGAASVGRPDFIQQQLSLGLAMVIIGGPLWFLFWRSAQRYANTQVEIGSISRKVFLNLILVVSALIALFAAQDTFKWLLSGAPQTPNAAGSLANFIVTAVIWYYYWRISETEGHPSRVAKTLRRWYVYIVSGWGLVWLSTGLIELIYSGALSLGIWGGSLAGTPFLAGAAQSNIPGIILGGLWWGFHWFYLARNDADSTLRQVYIHLFAITGSAIAGLVALVIGLNQVFVWAFGFADNPTYFQFLGWVIPTIIVSAGIWSYHQILAQEESGQIQERRLSARRVHLYIMSFLGLGTLVSGLVILIGILLNLLADGISPPVTIEAGWWQKQLSLALGLLIVATPIWWYYWNQIVRIAALGGIVEWRARSRRIYLYAIVAAAILGLAADFVNIIYQIMSGALTGNFGVNVLRNSIWSIQSLVVAAPLLVYHWRIVREDQRRGAEIPAARKIVTILAGSEAQDLISRLEAKVGSKVQVLQQLGGITENLPNSDEEINSLVNQIEASPTAKVMLVIHDGKLLVLPYLDK